MANIIYRNARAFIFISASLGKSITHRAEPYIILGGLFLIYKVTKEIYERVELPDDEQKNHRQISSLYLSKAIIQITAINFVFSFDSILTTVGMTNGLGHAVLIMGVVIVVSIFIMMLFAGHVGGFVSKHPSLQVLGIAFLLFNWLYVSY